MKQEKEIEKRIKRMIVYYIRIDLNNIADDGSINYFKVPKSTVTLLQDVDGIFSRGISMCSPLDIFNKKQGRALSYNRAVAGLEAKKKIGPINRRDDIHIEDGMNYKIDYNPVLTEYEKKLLKGPKEA